MLDSMTGGIWMKSERAIRMRPAGAENKLGILAAIVILSAISIAVITTAANEEMVLSMVNAGDELYAKTFNIEPVQGAQVLRDLAGRNLPEELAVVQIGEQKRLAGEKIIEEKSDVVYATERVNYYTGPGASYEKVGTIKRRDEINRTGICENGWIRVSINNATYYVYGMSTSTEKPKPQAFDAGTGEYTPEYLRWRGAIYWGGYRFTWYSENVLPGNGLVIPGRWSDGNFVRDEEGYICVASSDLPKGTIVKTPWGTAKVYDCGCASGTIDMYVSW